MNACDQLAAEATGGVAPSLRAVDCLANDAAAGAFGRLFGSNGSLLPALTILLTLYIAFFAISLLTGRSRIGISALTPRMMTLGLVLTFATSWVAYQGVVWNLAVGGPDEIAGVLMGTKGSATQVFADRIDMVFAAIADVADAAKTEQGAATQAASGSFTPGNLMWLSAMLLLLGTVGVLVTARIALAVLLAIGPIFVVMALFNGTRGLFVGWLRGVVLTAVVPLFAVLGGGFMLQLALPIVVELHGAEGIDGRAAMALFLIASVHVALMAMVLKVAGSIVSGWQVFGLAGGSGSDGQRGASSMPMPSIITETPASAMPPMTGARRAMAVAPAAASAALAPEASSSTTAIVRNGRAVVAPQSAAPTSHRSLPQQRARGVGSRFRAQPAHNREILR